MFRTVAILVYCGLIGCGDCADLRCSTPGPSDLKFSVKSLRNQTGHWTAQVQLEHGAGHKETGPWEVDIDHITTTCEDKESILIVATVTGPPQRPGKDYELVPGLGYYKFHTSTKTWSDARDACVQEGTHLLILNSEKEAGVISSIWKRYPKILEGWRNSCAYIGIHDEYTEGEFITLFGEPLNATGYTKWAQYEPGEGTSGNSGCVGREGALYDTNGANLLTFFCEQEL